eukprot:CAMPEP_0116885230 /NCGR_PEP_ID=MMETSP0463-20121206/18514_1 /TAXON_ID=181622 /ORGANISM="Strombidinopsis sp, Strain SopsisLIS2011" /LENGTH=48 /DNA_ID= /DNA_START= /DNA_END= /DNA_ORIENTATION=
MEEYTSSNKFNTRRDKEDEENTSSRDQPSATPSTKRQMTYNRPSSEED